MLPGLVTYVEPGYDGFPSWKTFTLQQAVDQQKFLAAQIRPGFVYAYDSDALLDFITVHWASFVELP